MKVKNSMISVLLVLAALLSLIIPFRALFTGDGTYAWQVRQPESISMLIETVILFILLGGVFFLIRSRKIRLSAAAAICIAFCWLHVTFLPMLVSGLYVGYLILAGRFVRTRLLKVSVPYGVFADFLVGSSLVISEFCLLSAFRIGSIPLLRGVSLIQGTALYLWLLYKKRKEARACFKNPSGNPHIPFRGLSTAPYIPAALFTFLTVMVLIQIGKMNITLDFDTLWYGVRSEYILNNGNGIYENPGLVGMAYVYSKGLEVLVLPLSDLVSHSYLLFFNVWMAVLGLMAVYRIARFYMEENDALLAAALVSGVPGVMNMCISTKPDIITWLLQLIMIVYLLCYIEETAAGGKRRPAVFLILAAADYLLSLTMKPTSLIFSTAVFGMAGLFLIVTKRVSLKAPLKHWLLLVPSAAALTGIWARTMVITGMPVTSVFTSIFAKLGFQMKYPFATGSLPQNWQEESNIEVLVRRLYQMLLAPEGKDMGHVVFAWGTSLLFFLSVCLVIFAVCGVIKRQKKGVFLSFSHIVFWPFLAVNLVSLVMLYQVDGNYFILLYTAVIIGACGAFSWLTEGGVRRICMVLLVPIMAFNVLMCSQSNWAWSMGFSDIELVNSGRVNHEKLQQEAMAEEGNTKIWEILSMDSSNRVIAFGDHPFSLQFPCIVQSYKDITSPWGNVELVNSPEAFEEYMTYTGADYIYAEADYIGEESWSWSYGLLQDLIERGALTNLYFENGNMLAVVNLDQRADSGAENLQLFKENYRAAQ